MRRRRYSFSTHNEIGSRNPAIRTALAFVALFGGLPEAFDALGVDAGHRIYKIEFVIDGLMVKSGYLKVCGLVASPAVGVEGCFRFDMRNEGGGQGSRAAVRNRDDETC